MASTVYDAGTNQYYLKVGSQTAAATGLTMTATTTTDAAVSGAYTVAKATTNADVTETDTTPYDTDGLMTKQAGTGINILTAASAETALTAVAGAMSDQDAARAKFGYMINRLQSTGDVLGIQSENLSTAESRISDVDVATEMATLTRNQVLAQAGTAMLAQANSIPQMALTLLR
jgi:flagellin-like hook-associated protein FlgL